MISAIQHPQKKKKKMYGKKNAFLEKNNFCVS